jgi:hypothetical protein
LREMREKDAKEREAREYSKEGPETAKAGTSRPIPNQSSKRPPAPTAKTFMGSEDDMYSYKPYDQPKQSACGKSISSQDSESSYAPSQSTSRSSAPPSHHGPYSTKDPDKVVIKAVYSFEGKYLKAPTSQLVSGVGSVTDGLVLRITVEGLFIDDDARGVPQREWDVKAWSLKLIEVCYLIHLQEKSVNILTVITDRQKSLDRLMRLASYCP